LNLALMLLGFSPHSSLRNHPLLLLQVPTPVMKRILEQELAEEQADKDEEVEVLVAFYSVLNMSFDAPNSQEK